MILNKMFNNVFDSKIASFGSSSTLVYMPHNKTHATDPPTGMATLCVFKKDIKKWTAIERGSTIHSPEFEAKSVTQQIVIQLKWNSKRQSLHS